MRKFLTLLAVLVLLGSLAFSQSKVITGKVTDQAGQAVPFATIRIKGSKIGTSADAEGYYSIKATSAETLVITGTGVSAKEVVVGDVTTLNITVQHQATSLSEVVVTSLGIQRQSKELGYSTAKISTGELTQARVVNVGTGLAAKVSGLQIALVNNSVKPDIRVTLRGDRSILGNNEALLVFDGIQLPITYLATLNPDDIANVTVLKGAAASALYGSSASNGVLIVTSRKGRSKPQITFSSTINFESIAYTPNFQNQFGQYGGEGNNNPLSANPYAGVVGMSSTPYVVYVPYENQNYGPRFNGQKVPLGAPIRIYSADGSSYVIKQDSINYSALPNAKTGFFNTGIQTQNGLTFAVGDDKSNFYISFQDVNSKGIIPNDVSRRDNFHINGTRTDGIFSANYSINYTITNTNTTAGDGVPFRWGTSPYYANSSGLIPGYTGGGSYFQNRPLYWNIINQPADVNLRNYSNLNDPFSNPNGYFNAYYGNPWWQIYNSRLAESQADLLGTLSLDLKPLSWLDLNYRVSIARDDYNNKYTQAGITFAPWAIADTLGSGNIPSSVRVLSPSEGDGQSFNQTINSEFLIAGTKTFGDFNGKLILGSQLIANSLNIQAMSATALTIPDFYNISNRIGTPTVTQYTEQSRVFGVFGDLTIGYKNFLYLHGSLRNDWNSLLSPANRSYLYPAVDAAFVFTDGIKSMSNSNFLSFGKLRAAISQTAQVSIGPYQLQNTFATGAGYPYGSTAGYTVVPTFANPNIKPEISLDEEIGLDLGFINNRINFSVAVYKTNTTNQTIPISISAATGYTTALVNSGVMQNQGIELDLKFTPLLKTESGFRWDIGGNFSYNQNLVKSLGYGLPQVTINNSLATQNQISVSTAAAVGKAYGQIQTSDWVRSPSGQIVVDPVTGLPTLNNNPVLFGTSVPPTKVGVFTTVSYKGFVLNAVMDGRFGAVIFNGIGPALDFTGVSAYSASSGRQPFVIPNSVIDQGSGKFTPNTNVTTGNPNLGAQSLWANVWNTAGSNYVNSADFWKLRELSLTYNFPAKWLNGTKIINAASLGFVARNLVTIRAKDNIWSDPEFSNTNGNASGNTDINQLPPTKFLGFNLSLTF
jgi:TonB-linked SusC/RagA family outer membrane protein